MATADGSVSDCPVCHEQFHTPKLLPCAHVVCRKCLVSWLEKDGAQNGCPLCRAPILPADLQGQGDLASKVDELPTDLATVQLVESDQALSERHECSCCDDPQADVFCLQCSIKLCSACARTHSKIPTTQDHDTEQLSNLSAERLAAYRPVFCAFHKGKQAELFCTEHEELVCTLCVASSHKHASTFQKIEDVVLMKREELRSLIQRLEDREGTVTAKINQLDSELSDAKTKFKAMRAEIKVKFDDLQCCMETQRQKMNADVQARENNYLAEWKSSKLDLENMQAALSAHKTKVQSLVTSASDAALLGMMGKLMALLSSVEGAALPQDPKSTVGNLLLKSDHVDLVKKAVAVVGAINDSEDDKSEDWCPSCSPLWCTVTWHNGRCKCCDRPFELEGPGYGAVIKVGDKVMRGRDWNRGSQDGDPPGLGTVTEVGTDLRNRCVYVKWDCDGGEHDYAMGYNNCYRLKFASER